MAINYSPRVNTDGLQIVVDAANNNSFPSLTLPIKDGLILWLDGDDSSSVVTGVFNSYTVTISNASPAVVTFSVNHNFNPGDVIYFTTTGGLPNGLSTFTKYYVLREAISATTFRVSSTFEGTPINTSSAGSGTHSAFRTTEVSSWKDKSGLNNHAYLNSSAPSYSYFFNGRKAISFNKSGGATNGLILNTPLIGGLTTLTIFSVSRRLVNTSSTADYICGNYGVSATTGFQMYFYGTDLLVYNTNAGNIVLQGNRYSGVPHINAYVQAGNSTNQCNLYSQGALVATGTNSQSIASTYNFVIGNGPNYTGERFRGEIAEIIVYNRALNVDEIRLVNNYLSYKWGAVVDDTTSRDLCSKTQFKDYAGHPVFNDPDAVTIPAIKFDRGFNTGQTLSATYPSIKSQQNYTRSVWFRIDNWTAEFQPIVLNSRGNNADMAIIINANTGSYGFHQYNKTANSGTTDLDYTTTGNSLLRLKTWYNVTVVVKRGAAGNIKLYLNGVLDNGASGVDKVIGDSDSDDVVLGGPVNDISSAGRHFNGKIGYFSHYSRALTSSEILENYNQFKTRFFPEIVAGADLNLNATNSSSYSGSGTTWTDLSGNGYNATLHNSVGYSSLNGGYLTFDGVGNYATFTMTKIGTTISVEIWANYSTLADIMILGFGYYDVYANAAGSGVIGFNTGAGDIYGVNTVNNLGVLNQWTHFVFVMNTGSYTSNKIYINGVSQTMVQIQGSISAANANFNNGAGIIGGWLGGGYLYNGYMSTFRVYNKELTQAEVLQNYNATKDRYDLENNYQTSLARYYDPANYKSYIRSGTEYRNVKNVFNATTLTAGNLYITGPVFYEAHGGVFYFDGVSDYFILNESNQNLNGNGITVGSNTNWTWSFWFKTSATNTMTLFSHYSGSPVTMNLGLSGGLIAYFHYSSTWINDYGTTRIDDGNWHQVVFANSSDSYMTIYLDGRLEVPRYSAPLSASFHNVIGGGYYGGFIGYLGIVTQHTVTLTQDQVLQNYNAQKSRYGY